MFKITSKLFDKTKPSTLGQASIKISGFAAQKPTLLSKCTTECQVY